MLEDDANQVVPVSFSADRLHGQSAVFGVAELAKPASSLGSFWLPPALRSLAEPRSHSACPERLRGRRQAVPKSLTSLPLVPACSPFSGGAAEPLSMP